MSAAATKDVLDKLQTDAKSWCPECGPRVSTDEDGCCSACGATATGPGAVRAEAVEVEVERLRALLIEARDNVEASTAETGISDDRRRYRHGLLARISTALAVKEPTTRCDSCDPSFTCFSQPEKCCKRVKP